MLPPSEVALEDRAIRPDVADQFQIAFELDESPTTLAEWAEVTSRFLDSARRLANLDDWCRVSSSRHVLRSSERIHFRGLFDALLGALIRAGSTAVTIRSRSPVSERVVEIHVADGEPSVTPDDSVMSFGVATDVVSTEYFEVPNRIAYTRFSQYTNAFSEVSAYERWADATTEAATMMIPLPVGIALAQRVLSG